MTANKIGLIVFSRFSSSRLPGKALMPVNGRPLLGCLLDRLSLLGNDFGPLVVATSDLPSDDAIVDFVVSEGVEVFRGELDDVAGRALSCARSYGMDYFARICGDRPFVDPALIMTLAAELTKEKVDLVTNVLIKTYPSGMATEIISTDALEKALSQTSNPDDREHVTRYFYNHQNQFSITNVASGDQRLPTLNLSIDTNDDLKRICWIAEHFDRPELASLEQIVELALSYRSHYEKDFS